MIVAVNNEDCDSLFTVNIDTHHPQVGAKTGAGSVRQTLESTLRTRPQDTDGKLVARGRPIPRKYVVWLIIKKKGNNTSTIYLIYLTFHM